MNKKIKVLHITSGLDGGGVERLLLDYYSNMDHNKIHFDFITTREKRGMLEGSFENMGCKIYRVTPLRTNFYKYIVAIYKVMQDNSYDIIHCHGGYKSAIALIIAKHLGVKARIAHSHMAYVPETIYTHIIRMFFTYFTKLYATHLFACGNDAALWAWGERLFYEGKIYIMTNAINTDRFQFKRNIRELLRTQLDLKDKFVVGNVGRISYQKNQKFLLDVLSDLRKTNTNIVLMIIGRGEQEQELKRYAKSLDIEGSVLFMGIRDDVSDLLNVMDVFALPSLWEGLPVTLVEVQANGLPAYVSNNITKEIAINPNIMYLPLNKSLWEQMIQNCQNKRILNGVKNIQIKGYSVAKEATGLFKKYDQILSLIRN